ESSDAGLRGAFPGGHAPAAFAVLVERYGPLVLGLCRRIVQHEQDAEDAFQATFLVFVRKAGAIGKHESVGSWLYGVAYRVSMKAKVAAARQHARQTALSSEPAADDG